MYGQHLQSSKMTCASARTEMPPPVPRLTLKNKPTLTPAKARTDSRAALNAICGALGEESISFRDSSSVFLKAFMRWDIRNQLTSQSSHEINTAVI